MLPQLLTLGCFSLQYTAFQCSIYLHQIHDIAGGSEHHCNRLITILLVCLPNLTATQKVQVGYHSHITRTMG